MTSMDYGNLIYLVLLGSVLILWFVIESRESLSKKVKQLAAWGLIFLSVIAAYGMWGDIQRATVPTQAVFAGDNRVELPRAPDGHYYLTLKVNGATVPFMVDTGASGVVLTRRDAERAGLDAANMAFYSEAMTANGLVKIAPVTLDSVVLGPFEDRNLPAAVNGGEMQQSLLGMTYLQRFSRLEISNGRMILER
ncbi:TIGR02281 family clan AA aspartic protease [Mesobacterium sp. TK19101]|uniref:TIGR02281 family clan AA aspartic protease n=1 Tax=Mesobacterium hydrothermale TaxID=3111907 RepID=A0ABU6HH33_9RHOB|nr:TIGR02281 family clan AA aspartic protease [Mesobacterium sp. TK19101]MEC3861768.1 TIGR02281 family clan AA aspartic protease [Mesobacterium sp. TK19101]